MSKICDYTKNFNKHLGLTIQELRVIKGISRQSLADRIGVTFQQLYKYENGVNNITTAKFFLIAKSLDQDLSYFNELLNWENRGILNSKYNNLTRLIMHNVGKIKNTEQKQAIHNLIKAIIESADD